MESYGRVVVSYRLCMRCMELVLDIFFFQAEDGIRDAQESRGLGDVYKRQVKGTVLKVNPFGLFVKLDDEIHGLAHITQLGINPVSYTHLTLPTIYSV
mgnify:CR=1 FL=1